MGRVGWGGEGGGGLVRFRTTAPKREYHHVVVGVCSSLVNDERSGSVLGLGSPCVECHFGGGTREAFITWPGSQAAEERASEFHCCMGKPGKAGARAECASTARQRVAWPASFASWPPNCAGSVHIEGVVDMAWHGMGNQTKEKEGRLGIAAAGRARIWSLVHGYPSVARTPSRRLLLAASSLCAPMFRNAGHRSARPAAGSSRVVPGGEADG